MENTQLAQEVPTEESPKVAEVESEVSETTDDAEESSTAVSQDEEQGDSSEGNSDEESFVEFPKKATNIIKRKNKTISTLRKQLQEIELKLNESNPKEIDRPEEGQFDSYSDFLKADVLSEVERKLTQAQSEQQKAVLQQQKAQLQAERDQHIVEQTQQLSTQIPELKPTLAAYTSVLDSLPEQITDVFYGIENAPLAAYVLAKEGKLESLPYVSPMQAAYEIMSAENRGRELLKKQPTSSNPNVAVSNAPKPISAARGTAKTVKDLSQGDVLKNLGLK